MRKAWKSSVTWAAACTLLAATTYAAAPSGATCGPTPVVAAAAAPTDANDLTLLAVPRLGTLGKMLYATVVRAGVASDGSNQRQALLINGAASLTWPSDAAADGTVYAYIDTNADGMCSAGDALYGQPLAPQDGNVLAPSPSGWRLFLQDMAANPNACQFFQNNASRTGAFALSLDATAGNPRKIDHIQMQKNTTVWRLELNPTLTPEAFAAGGSFTLTLQDAQGATIQVFSLDHVWSDVELRY